jgi:nicotinate-nucleotide adenylyltransferase
MREVPVAVVARPWITLKSRFSPAAQRFRHARIPALAARTLPRRKPPAWVYLNGPLNFTSSTALRRKAAESPGALQITP